MTPCHDVASGSAGLGAGVVAGLATGGAVALIAVGVAIKARRDRRTAGYTQVDGNVAPRTEVKSSTPLLI